MSATKVRNADPPALIKERLLLFLYGITIHLGLGFLSLRLAFNSTILSPTVLVLAITLSGGLALSAWMEGLLRQTLRNPGSSNLGVMARAGLKGMLTAATVMLVISALEAIAVVGPLNPNLNWGEINLFNLALMDTVTYNLGQVLITLPIAFIYGAIAGSYLRWITKRQSLHGYVPEAAARQSVAPIIWSISGLIMAFVPIAGTACSTIGLVQGALALRMQGADAQHRKTLPLAAVIIGGVGILWLFFSIFVYVMVGHGWFKVSG